MLTSAEEDALGGRDFVFGLPSATSESMETDMELALTEVQVEDRVSFTYREDERYVHILGRYGGLYLTDQGAIRLLVHRRWGDYYYDVRRISALTRKLPKPRTLARAFSDASRIGAPTPEQAGRAERYQADPVQMDVYECWRCGNLFTPPRPGGAPVCACRKREEAGE
jgi:hypothetical protein